jgi:hypothetical protein
MTDVQIGRIRPPGAIPHVAGLAHAVPAIKAPVAEAAAPDTPPAAPAVTQRSIDASVRDLRASITALCSIKVIDAKEAGRNRFPGKPREVIDAAIDYELATLAMFNVRDDDQFPAVDFMTKTLASMAIKELQIRMFDRLGRARGT